MSLTECEGKLKYVFSESFVSRIATESTRRVAECITFGSFFTIPFLDVNIQLHNGKNRNGPLLQTY